MQKRHLSDRPLAVRETPSPPEEGCELYPYNESHLSEHDWENLIAEEERIAADGTAAASNEGFEALCNFSGRENSTDSLGTALSFFSACLAKGLPWVATKTSFTAFSNAFSHASSPSSEVATSMVWLAYRRLPLVARPPEPLAPGGRPLHLRRLELVFRPPSSPS